jgi:hypothetical protein
MARAVPRLERPVCLHLYLCVYTQQHIAHVNSRWVWHANAPSSSKIQNKNNLHHTHTHKTQYKIYNLNYPEKLRFYIHIASPGHLFLIDSDAPNSKTLTSQHNSLIILQLFLFVDDVCVFITGLLYIGTTIFYFCSSAIK